MSPARSQKVYVAGSSSSFLDNSRSCSPSIAELWYDGLDKKVTALLHSVPRPNNGTYHALSIINATVFTGCSYFPALVGFILSLEVAGCIIIHFCKQMSHRQSLIPPFTKHLPIFANLRLWGMLQLFYKCVHQATMELNTAPEKGENWTGSSDQLSNEEGAQRRERERERERERSTQESFHHVFDNFQSYISDHPAMFWLQGGDISVCFAVALNGFRGTPNCSIYVSAKRMKNIENIKHRTHNIQYTWNTEHRTWNLEYMSWTQVV